MFKHLAAQDQIEGFIAKAQVGGIAPNAANILLVDRWRIEVERSDECEVTGQLPRNKAISGSDVQCGGEVARYQTH